MTLDELGFTQWHQEKADELSPGDFIPARITAVHKGSYEVKSESGIAFAELTGRFMYTAETNMDYPTVGDWVLIQLFDEGNLAVIHALLPRKTLLKRKTPGKLDVQLIGANIDTAFIVQGADGNFGLNRLDRYLVMVHESGSQPVLLLSKTDLVAAEELNAMIQAVQSAYPDLDVIGFSNHADDGLTAVRDKLLPGKTYCLLGSSGVGKTSLLNNLLGEDAFDVKDVREWDGKGRHTTTSRQLIQLENGALFIDTPGMRELGNFDVEIGLSSTYEDIYSIAEGCRFNDCTHVHEAGCAVRAAVNDGRLDADRLNNFIRLQRESAYFSMSDLERRRRDRILGKSYKAIKNESRKRKDSGSQET